MDESYAPFPLSLTLEKNVNRDIYIERERVHAVHLLVERLSINVQAKLFLPCGLKAPLYFPPPFETVEILFNFIFHRVSGNNETIHCEKFLFSNEIYVIFVLLSQFN